MAKYDIFKVSEKFNVGVNEGTVELSVLFEDGDDITSVMVAAQSQVDNHIADENTGGSGSPTVEGALLYLQELTKEQVRDVCRQYWTSVMSTLGDDRSNYVEQLRDDIRIARNQSN